MGKGKKESLAPAVSVAVAALSFWCNNEERRKKGIFAPTMREELKGEGAWGKGEKVARASCKRSW